MKRTYVVLVEQAVREADSDDTLFAFVMLGEYEAQGPWEATVAARDAHNLPPGPLVVIPAAHWTVRGE